MIPTREIPRTGVDAVGGRGYSSKKYEEQILQKRNWDPVVAKTYNIVMTEEEKEKIREQQKADREEVRKRNFDDELKQNTVVRSTNSVQDQVSKFLEKYRRKDNFH